MLDLNPIASVLKTVLPPTPQAAPRVAEETAPVPEAVTGEAVPPPAPAKGNDPGLGGNVDLYSGTAAQARLLGEESEPQAMAPHPDLPFLKPLGRVRGQAIDARI